MHTQYSRNGEWLPELDIDPPPRQRRLTVLLRLLLLIPQFIVVWLLGVGAFVVAVIGWFAALVIGRLPDWAAAYLAAYVAYYARVNASASLLIDTYPPFSLDPEHFPVRVELRPGELNRLAVLLRIFLAIPAAIVTAVITSGWTVCAIFIWLVVLVLGRIPDAAFEATAAVVRYTMRMQAYWLMLTSAYPKRLFGEGSLADSPDSTRESATRPLLIGGAGQLLLVIFIIVGIFDLVASGNVRQESSATAPQRPPISSLHTSG